MREIQFRKAIIPDEIPQLFDFDRKVFDAYPADIFLLEDWQKYESDWMILDGEIVGCAAFQTDKGSELWIASTAILPERRRQRLGEKLKDWEIKYAKSKGFERIGTVVRQSNEAILRLNEKFGFRRAKVIPGRYSDPDEPGIVMQLELPLPNCPACGKPLRTHRAKQCRFCGANWH